MGFICIPFLVLPSKILKYPTKIWIKVIFILLEQICNIKHQIIGLENIPDETVLVASKHQSAFETFYLQTIFRGPKFILKKELIKIPVIGWY